MLTFIHSKTPYILKTPITKNLAGGDSITSKSYFQSILPMTFLYLILLKFNNINTFRYFCKIIIVQVLKPLFFKIVQLESEDLLIPIFWIRYFDDM